MSLISKLKSLFRRPTLYDLAKAQRDQELVEAMAASTFILMATPDVEGLPMADFNPETLLEMVEKAAAKLKDRETFTPFSYEHLGVTLLPVFTTMENAEAFAGAYSSREQTLFQFPMRAVDASVLTYWIGYYKQHSVILDSQAEDEIILTPAQVDLLTQVCPPAEESEALSMDHSGDRELVVPSPGV